MVNNTSNKQAANDVCSSASTTESDISEEQEINKTVSHKKANQVKTKSDNTSTKTPLSPKEKKKKKKKYVSICLTNCRYEIIRKVAQKFGLKETSETENWNLYWTDLSISIERCKEMKRFQRINHFPGMLEICRKDLLARNLNRMAKLYPKDYNFFPKTWCLPADLGDALNYSRLRKNKTFILKPDAGSQGRGIYITKTLKDIKPTEKMICQVYIARPFLIDGYKFDLRVYTLLTSCDPLRIYVYNEGLVRFATSRYHEPTGVNSSNVFMHLTNYAVNKHSRTYNCDDESGSKRKLSWFNTYMRALGHDVSRLWQRIDEVIIKTIFSALPILKHSYHACFPNHDLLPACCELLGMDIILDRHLCPQLLEVNHSPSFHTDTVLDYEVKENLLTDMFAMLNLEHCDKRKIIREDRKRIQERLTRIHNKEENSKEASSSVSSNKNFQDYYKHEINNRGGYRLVYPEPKTEHFYLKFLRQGQGSLYCDTACSNARQVAAAAMRDEMQIKAKEEAAKRSTPKSKDKIQIKPLQTPTSNPLKPSTNSSSFEPQMIVESEEKERLIMLAHRDFLVKSYGLVDHVYLLLKKNGALRPIDEKKYNMLKSATASMSSNIQVDKDERGRVKPAIKNLLDFSDNIDSKLMKCDVAQLYNSTRPDLPDSWLPGTNKLQIHRAMSNHVKIHTNQNREERDKKNLGLKFSQKPGCEDV